MKIIAVAGLLLILTAAGTYWYLNSPNLSDEDSVTIHSTATSSQQNSNDTKNPARKVVGVAGTYENENGVLKFMEAGSNRISVTGNATWDSGQSANSGEVDGVAARIGQSDSYVYSRPSYIDEYKECEVTFSFRTDVVEVTTDNVLSCGWGLNVDFAGTYTRTSEM